jgi:hypothetical protein
MTCGWVPTVARLDLYLLLAELNFVSVAAVARLDSCLQLAELKRALGGDHGKV